MKYIPKSSCVSEGSLIANVEDERRFPTVCDMPGSFWMDYFILMNHCYGLTYETIRGIFRNPELNVTGKDGGGVLVCGCIVHYQFP